MKVKSVSLPLAEIFCTTISTFIELSDKGLKIDAAIPGLSLPKSYLASFVVFEIPVIILLFTIFFLLVIKVPSLSVKEDLTSISTLFNLAS